MGGVRDLIGPGPRQPCGLCGANSPRPLRTVDGFEIAHCGSCGVVYVVNPVPVEEVARLYSGNYFGDLALERPSEWYPVLEGINRQRLLKIEHYVPCGRLLDVGCGTGTFLKEARQKGWEVMGLEISPQAARYARERFDLNVVTTRVEDAKLPEGWADVATVWHLIEHVENPAGTLRRLYNYLKPGGLLVVETPNAEDPRGGLHLWKEDGHPRYHRYLFSPRSLRRALEGSGFRKTRTVFWGYRLPPVSSRDGWTQGLRLKAKSLLSRVGKDSVITALSWKASLDRK